MNEKQLAIGETTFDGNRALLNRNGVFWIEELERLATIYWDKTRKFLEPARENFERMMLEQDKSLQKKAAALYDEGRDAEAEEMLNIQTDSFFHMVAGKWRELKGRALEIFARSL